MRVGMIFECGPDGADRKVCEHLGRRLQSDIEVVCVTLGDKKQLLAGCGGAALGLLRERCERIVIVWDLHPPWRPKRQKPCRREDRGAILSSLTRARVRSSHAFLVCVEEELEAWLLADGRAISKVLSRQAHPVRIQDVNKPERVSKPKTRLNKIFQQHSGRPYVDRLHAKLIVEALPDLTKIKRCATFWKTNMRPARCCLASPPLDVPCTSKYRLRKRI